MATSDHDGSGGKTRERPEPRVPPHVPWGVLEAVGCLAAYVLLQACVAVLVAAAGLKDDLQVCSALPSFILGGAMLCVFVRYRAGSNARCFRLLGLRWPEGVKPMGTVEPLFVGGAAYVLVLIALAAVLARFDVQPELQPLARMIRDTESRAMLVMACVVAVGLAPLVEECLFRSVVYLPLRARFGVLPGALIVSVVFAALHLYPLGVPQLIVLSATFVWLFERTGTLWPAILVHAVYNGVNVLVFRLVAWPA